MAYLRENATVLLVVAVIFEAVIAILWRRQIISLRARLDATVEAAEDAARAAALAAPGALDPEVVLHLIRSGQTPTLDTVSEIMRRQENAAAPAGRRSLRQG
ncbi:MAG: hypothetical protein NVSMB29_07440 [Candidatus Dormibacteria bacterium]